MEEKNKQIQVTEMNAPLTAAIIRGQVNLIQEVMKEVMQGPSRENPNGVHYGLIPGCGDKPTLLKPGAEKLFLTFRLRPIIDPALDVVITEMPNGHRDYRVHCHILNMQGIEMATGVGSASTMESKHRYRGEAKEGTGQPLPPAYWDMKKEGKLKEAQSLIGGPGYGPGKIDGKWEICKTGAKMENPDIADQYNTVLKMACKRAKVDGCLSATACSDIFTQDIEDFAPTTTHPATPTPATAAPHQTPQRKSETELTAEEIAAKAEKAKAALHAADGAKSEPAKPQAPANGLMTATGLLTGHGEPNAGGYVAWEMDNQQREDGKSAKFASKDMEILNILTEKMEAGEKVTLEYKPSDNPRFAHNIVSVKQGIAEAK